jgi:uncharacterized protein YjdB
MKTRFLLFAATLCCIFLTQKMDAQVTSVNYRLKYNPDSCRYEAYVVINSGTATSAAQRTQFNSQFTIVVPQADSIVLDSVTSYAPYQNNTVAGSSTTPMEWNITTKLRAPGASPSNRFYSITPNLSPASRYGTALKPTLQPGDEILLFTFNVSSISTCGSGIRIWENGSDPQSDQSGMQNSDFSNGFTLGGISQLYNANSTQLHPPAPVLLTVTSTCAAGIEIDLTDSTRTCQLPLTYSWAGPGGYTTNTQDVSRPTATVADQGTYTVTVTDFYGCTATTSVITSSKPSAGVDQTACAGSTVTISGTEPTTGTWAAQTGNPTGATLSPIGGGEATVTFTNAAEGVYRFIYSTTSCSDTMAVTVSRKAVVSATSSLICVGATTTLNSDSTGVWTSSNNGIASVSGNTVTGVSQGSVTFTLTQASGCTSTTSPVVVNPRPTVSVTGTPAVCIGATTTLSPTTGGTWASSNGAVATVSNGGVVTGVAAGTAKFAFTETATGCISDSLTVTVTTQPTAGIDPSGNDSICVLTSTQLTPNTGGTWLSSDPAVATVSNSGLVTGLTAGSAKFVWTETVTGCKSDSVGPVIVTARPTVTASPPTICVGGTTTLSPTTGGTWASSNALIASITNGGVVTGVAQGTTNFTFTETASGCSNTTGNININPRPTVLAAAGTICVGATTTLTPSTGGSWSSGTPGVATVIGNTVTGVSAGTSIMTFTESGTGCTNTLTITVDARPTATLNNPAAICPGFTTTVTVSPAQAGSWASSNFSIATVSNGGLVTGIAVGTSTFTFTSSVSGCVSLPTSPVTINSKPTVSITGSNQICISATTTLAASPVGPGTWTALNPLVASINASTGVVTAVGPGSAQFTFTDATGCVSDASSPVTVNIPAPASFTGPSTICEGFTTQLSPVTGGTWLSSNPLIATVNNAGLVSGIAAGTVKFIFNNTATGCNSDSLSGTINPKPVVNLVGAGPICIDSSISTTTSIPGGTWVSSNTSIATVNATTGVITGVSQGTAIFTYTSSLGCASDPIISLAIMPRPTVNITGPTAICIGDSTTLSPNSGGTWTSSADTIATVNPTTGVVTGVAEGSVTFTFTSADGCVSLPSAPVTINPKPIVVVNGPSSICVGATSNATPAINGTWTSSDNAVATISNGGIITGVATGSATFRYTQTSTGCISDASTAVAVTPGPTITVPDTELCLGDQTTLVPNPVTAGTWTSSNSSVATISGAGVVTAVAQGTVTFTFRDNSGCSSQPSAVVTVNGRPSVGISGSSTICIGGTTKLSPTTGGTWVSSNAGIASVTDSIVTGVSAGSATFTFTLTSTGCQSLPTNPVTVTPAPVVSFSGPTALCVGGTTQVSSGGAGGVWTSSNPSVASVNPTTGVVTALAPGTASFTFVETATGCASAASTGNVTITHCFNPDFNATFVNVQVAGDVSTNDNVDPASTYGPTPTILEISKPSGGVYTLSINSDGTYTFIADKEGVYRFEVPVCTPPQVSGCPRSDLTITVRNNISTAPLPIANVDFASTPIATPVTLRTLSNDRCVQITGCTLDPATVTITDAPSHGSTSINSSTGDITYTPTTPGFVGMDTLTYQVCVTGGSPCATAKQIITINSATAGNTTIAADDFAVTPQNTPVSGNVKTNDSDPEGDDQTVTAQNTTTVTGKGTLALQTDGSYTFTPVDGFYGPVEFTYQTIDDNASPDTAYATLHILVMQDLTLRVRVYLEGSLLNNANAMAEGRPLMRDNLRSSIFAGQTGVRYIPDVDPYEEVHGTVDVLSKFDHVAPWDSTRFMTIPNPTGVFAVTGQNAIVDWVYIELRSKTSNSTVVVTRSGLLQRDGDVVDLDGVSGLRFPGVVMDDYYVVVRHHSHLGAMTAAAQTPLQLTTLVNFTSPSTTNWDYGTTNPNGVVGGINYTGLAQQNVVKSGITYRALWAGDFDANGKIKNDNPGDDINALSTGVLLYAPPSNITYYPYTGGTPTTTPSNTGFTSNFDFGYGYLQGDFDMNGKAKFDNPDDDKNMLYGQLLFYALNASLLSNFDHFIEQLP